MWAFVPKSRLLFILNTKKGFMFAPMVDEKKWKQLQWFSHLRQHKWRFTWDYMYYISFGYSHLLFLHRYFYFVVVTTGRECVCVFFSFLLLLFRSSPFSFRFSLFTFSHSFNFLALFLPNEITFVMKMYTYICICVGYMCKQRVLYFVGVEIYIYIFMSVYSVWLHWVSDLRYIFKVHALFILSLYAGEKM